MLERPQALTELPEGYEFHHVGYATTSLQKERSFFAFLGYRQEGEDFVDPIQGVMGCFLVGSGPRIELLENLPGADTLTPWLNAGIKMYHLAYLVADIERALEWACSKRAGNRGAGAGCCIWRTAHQFCHVP